MSAGWSVMDSGKRGRGAQLETGSVWVLVFGCDWIPLFETVSRAPMLVAMIECGFGVKRYFVTDCFFGRHDLVVCLDSFATMVMSWPQVDFSVMDINWCYRKVVS